MYHPQYAHHKPYQILSFSEAAPSRLMRLRLSGNFFQLKLKFSLPRRQLIFLFIAAWKHLQY
jgi:hypothetical protein